MLTCRVNTSPFSWLHNRFLMVNSWIPVKQSRVAQKDPLPTALHDLRHVGRDLFGHKGATASRTLGVEEDAVAGKPRDDKKAVLQ